MPISTGLLTKVIIDPKERAALTDQILALPEVVGLRESEAAPVSRYTTDAVLAAEGQVMADADAGACRRATVSARRNARPSSIGMRR